MARRYFYDSGEEKIGPVSGEDLLRLRAEGEIDNTTWVRRENSQTWRPMASVDLREEEEDMRNPSILKMLLRNMSLKGLIMSVGIIIILVLLVAGIISVAWPLLLVILFLWLLRSFLR